MYFNFKLQLLVMTILFSASEP